MGKNDQEYWTQRYKDGDTGWDVGEATGPLIAYFEQVTQKNLKILIPGAGNAYEAEYLHSKGFKNVHILDISEIPLSNFKKRNPSFPEQHIHQQDFFKHKGTYDLIIEQTFFCSFEPDPMTRVKYATKMASLLVPKGKLVAVLFENTATQDSELRPYGASETEYRKYLSPHFEILTLEPSYNSIPSRQGSELFGIFQKKIKPKTQPNNPLHGITLKTIVTELVAHYGWEALGEQVRINSFVVNPSINSSLKFLRKTDWARKEVEQLYVRTFKM
ncbi:VF530 family DNA-binding protein [Marinirhabdus gelatinilytica]|uniref:Thiopurine S-methyltransferase n=1 Tax=Marinirhabdus gelatinilytica TaxID=1703343 RepID=A0A370QBI6_9FLAO|nr:VF530 family DNA-binding protein [Marinirhabdus gelatinilytica]RDK85370.1 thiopurine S-methyltransferase [Marinirhabdus gelatinilytica]